MRESKKGEKTHLPRDSTEVWLGKQKKAPSGPEHKKAPEASYEAWVKKRVGKDRGSRTKGRK